MPSVNCSLLPTIAPVGCTCAFSDLCVLFHQRDRLESLFRPWALRSSTTYHAPPLYGRPQGEFRRRFVKSTTIEWAYSRPAVVFVFTLHHWMYLIRLNRAVQGTRRDGEDFEHENHRFSRIRPASERGFPLVPSKSSNSESEAPANPQTEKR